MVELDEASILYQDDWLIAVDKPPGLPTHATLDPRRDHLHAATLRLLTRLGQKAYAGQHHRLDVGTSGVVLMTLDKAANKGVAELFAGRGVTKTYLALVEVASARSLADSFEVRNHLARDKARRGLMKAVRAGGDFALTHFQKLEVMGDRLLIQAQPHTGRTHQIRIHLAGVGCPIIGDDLYGGKAGPRLMLHAAALDFIHPKTGEAVHLEAPLPSDFT